MRVGTSVRDLSAYHGDVVKYSGIAHGLTIGCPMIRFSAKSVARAIELRDTDIG